MQQTITLTNVDSDPCNHMALLGRDQFTDN